MNSNNAKIISRIFLILAALILVSGAQAAAQDMPVLVAKPYPGAVPEHTKGGKHVTCGDNEEAYCFLTRDPVEKVRANYAQQGIRLESVTAEELAGIGGGRSDLVPLRVQLL